MPEDPVTKRIRDAYHAIDAVAILLASASRPGALTLTGTGLAVVLDRVARDLLDVQVEMAKR